MDLQHFSIQKNPQDVSDFCFLWCAFTSHLDASRAPVGAYRSRGIKGGGGSAHQPPAHQCQASLASWVVCMAELKVNTFGLLLNYNQSGFNFTFAARNVELAALHSSDEGA